MELAQAIKLAKNGQTDGFKAIFEHSADSIYFKAVALIKDSYNPLVLVHDTFISAFKSIDKLQSPSDFRVWLGKFFYNHIIKHSNTQNSIFSSDQNFENDDVFSVLKNFYLLPIEQKSILLFSYYDGCSSGQISEIVNLDETTIKRHIKNCKAEIENNIKQERKANIKVNAAAFTYSFCQYAKLEKIPSALFDGIFHNICIDSGLIPQSSERVEISYSLPPAQTSEPIKNEIPEEKTESFKEYKENNIPEEKIPTEESKKENKFSKSFFGKLFKGV